MTTPPTVASPWVVLVGPLPPPVHGMAAVNAAVADQLRSIGASVLVIDVAASSLDRAVWARFGRLPRVLAGLGRFIREPRAAAEALYMSVSGGLGQVYELLFVIVARIRAVPIFLHYHSYAYLDRPNLLTRALIAAAGRQTTHVVLSEGMALRLESAYPTAAGRTVAVSNAGLLLEPAGTTPPERVGLKTIGFLGNIAAEKGVFEFLDVVARLEEGAEPIEARLAGPFQDDETERAIRSRLDELTTTTYLGPLYGPDKTAFFREIDALLFPTKYVNEAEPLVIHEAMMHALPVIAYDRGAIREVVPETAGLVIDRNDDFVAPAVNRLLDWAASPTTYQAASRGAFAAHTHHRERGRRRWEGVASELVRVAEAHRGR